MVGGIHYIAIVHCLLFQIICRNAMVSYNRLAKTYIHRGEPNIIYNFGFYFIVKQWEIISYEVALLGII